MPDITVIAGALSSLKAAMDIAKILVGTDVSLQRAELKLKLADLINALADTKIELVKVQDALEQKEKRVSELEEAFESKDSLIRHGDAYYALDPSGKPVGVPFCLKCWDVEHKKRQLVYDYRDFKDSVCTGCGHRYDGMATTGIS